MFKIVLLVLVLLFSLFAHGARTEPLVILAVSIAFVFCAAILASLQVSKPTKWSAYWAALEIWTIFLLSTAVIGTTTGSWMYSGRNLAEDNVSSIALTISLQTIAFCFIFIKTFNAGGSFIRDVKRSASGLQPVRRVHGSISKLWEWLDSIPILTFKENIQKLKLLLFFFLGLLIGIVGIFDNATRNRLFDWVLKGLGS